MLEVRFRLNLLREGDMKRLIAMMAGTLWISAGYAATPSDLVKCSSIDDSVKRLVCYDDLANAEHQESTKSETKELQPPSESSGKWHISIDKSKIDDSSTVMAILFADEPVAGRFSRTATPALILRCLENVTSMYINFDGLFMSDTQNYGKVTFRVDKRPAFVKGMSASTSNKALGLWSGGSAIPFIKGLLGGTTLVVRAMPFNESARTMEFSIKGIEAAIEPIKKECKW